jgi:hypothetical protein
MTELDLAPPPGIDPDPFGVGIAIFAAMVSGATFLEARRQSQFLQQQQRSAFRAAWFDARRSVIFFKRSVDEFETYVLEDGYGRRAFRVGAIRLVVDSRRSHQMRRLRGSALITANNLGDNLDDLSDFLDAGYQEAIMAVLTGLNELGTLPDDYASLIARGRAVVGLYTALLEAVAEHEGFEEDTPHFTSGP